MSSSRPLGKYTEDGMPEARFYVTDNGFSPSQASQRWGVPRTTLIDRLNGQTAVKEHIQPVQRSFKNQEDKLAFWILRQESLGYAEKEGEKKLTVVNGSSSEESGSKPEADSVVEVKEESIPLGLRHELKEPKFNRYIISKLK